MKVFVVTLLALLFVACGTPSAILPTIAPDSRPTLTTIAPALVTTAPVASTPEILATLATDAPEPATAEQPTDAPATNEPTSAPAVPTEAPAATAIEEQPTAAMEPSMPPVPQQLPPSFANCQDDPNFAQAPNYPVLIATVNKASEIVTLKNVSPDAVSLDGWRMCSIKGNQQHPISGSLAPGEQRDFPGPAAASIWSNSDPDPGALYDGDGRLVSYWKN